MAENITKNASVSVVTIRADFAGRKVREFVNVPFDGKFDLNSDDDFERLYSACTRYVRAALRAEEIANASYWNITPDWDSLTCENVRYEIPASEFFAIAHPMASGEKADITRTRKGGTAVMNWVYMRESGTVSVPCESDPAEMSDSEFEKWYTKARKAALSDIARALTNENRSRDAAKKAAKIANITYSGTCELSEPVLYGCSYAELEQYKTVIA